MENLSRTVILPGELLHWAKVYAERAIAPPKDIPKLIKTFQKAVVALNREATLYGINSSVRQAIENLRQQLKESKKSEEKAK